MHYFIRRGPVDRLTERTGNVSRTRVGTVKARPYKLTHLSLTPIGIVRTIDVADFLPIVIVRTIDRGDSNNWNFPDN